MITKVGIYHEPARKRPWLVCWWGPPDPETGKQKKSSRSFRYKRAAQNFQATKQMAMNCGSRLRADDVTLGQLVEEFEDARLAKLSHSSQQCYANTIIQLREHFGVGALIRSIEQRHAESFMSSRQRRDGRRGDLSTWALAQHLKHCRAIFGAAVDWGYLQGNPFKPASPRGRTALHVKGKSRPWHHLTPAEFRDLLDATPSVRRRAMYWCMYACGLRPGEVVNLTVDRIDLARRVIHIDNREATADIPPFTVKSDSQSDQDKARSVSIPTAAIADLTAAVKMAMKAGGFIALTVSRFQVAQENWQMCRNGLPRGAAKHTRPWENRDMVNNVLRDAKADLRRAGVTLHGPFTLTTFRKSYAQNHADAGTPPKTLAGLLGHSDVRITLQYYNHVSDANQRAASDTIDKLFAAHFHCVSTGADSEGVA